MISAAFHFLFLTTDPGGGRVGSWLICPIFVVKVTKSTTAPKASARQAGIICELPLPLLLT